MRNSHDWKPTKVVRIKNGFGPSNDASQLAIGSRVFATQYITKYQKAIAENASGRLLDLGCGMVPYYEMYKEFVNDVTCVDWQNSLHPNEFIDHVADLNEPLAFASGSFDTVLLTDVLEHIFMPFELIAEISRILSPGGKLIIGVPFFYWIHEQPYDFHRHTEFSLRRLCESNCLKILSLTPYGGVPEIIADIACKCTAYFGQTTCRLVTRLLVMILSMTLVRSVSKKTSRLFPLGYVVVARKSQC